MKKMVFIAFAIVCSFTLVSCGSSSYVVSARPSEPYYQRPISPGPNYIWIDGDWIWRSNRYVYKQGYWSSPRPNRHWEPGRWQQGNRGWQWQHGNWRR